MRAYNAQKNELKPHLKEQWVIPPKPKQLVKETRTPVPAKPGQVRREDYEYERNGTANIFMLFEPLACWRYVKVTERRTKIDFAHVVKELVDELDPKPKPSCS